MINQQILDNYYKNQAGSGLAAYSGPKYQRGHGLNFGKIFRKLQPALKYIGKHGLRTLTSIGRDILDGENIGDSAKKHISVTGKRVANEMLNKADTYLNDQSGNGLIFTARKKYKRRRNSRKSKVSKKSIKKKTKKLKTKRFKKKRTSKKKSSFL